MPGFAGCPFPVKGLAVEKDIVFKIPAIMEIQGALGNKHP